MLEHVCCKCLNLEFMDEKKTHKFISKQWTWITGQIFTNFSSAVRDVAITIKFGWEILVWCGIFWYFCRERFQDKCLGQICSPDTQYRYRKNVRCVSCTPPPSPSLVPFSLPSPGSETCRKTPVHVFTVAYGSEAKRLGGVPCILSPLPPYPLLLAPVSWLQNTERRLCIHCGAWLRGWEVRRCLLYASPPGKSFCHLWFTQLPLLYLQTWCHRICFDSAQRRTKGPVHEAR